MFVQLGVGGILIILVLDKVFGFLKEKGDPLPKKNGSAIAGEQSTDYWRGEGKQIVKDALDSGVVNVLRQQVEILARLEARGSTTHEMALKTSFQIEDVNKNLEKLRETQHKISDGMQRLALGRREGDV